MLKKSLKKSRKNKIKNFKKYLKFLLTKHNMEWYNKTRSEQSGTV